MIDLSCLHIPFALIIQNSSSLDNQWLWQTAFHPRILHHVAPACEWRRNSEHGFELGCLTNIATEEPLVWRGRGGGARQEAHTRWWLGVSLPLAVTRPVDWWKLCMAGSVLSSFILCQGMAVEVGPKQKEPNKALDKDMLGGNWFVYVYTRMCRKDYR